MEKWTVEITQTALDDMEGIYDYIAFFWQRRMLWVNMTVLQMQFSLWKVILRDVRFSR